MLPLIVITACTLPLATAMCFQEEFQGGIIQYPKYVLTRPGASVMVTCSVIFHEEIEGVNLWKQFRSIMYIYKDNNITKEWDYMRRLTVSGTVLNFTATFVNLTKNDTDLYICNGLTKSRTDIYGDGTVIYVADHVEQKSPSEDRLIITIVLVSLIVLLTGILLFRIILNKIKSQEQTNRNMQNAVYEDMTQTIRRNEMGNSTYDI